VGREGRVIDKVTDLVENGGIAVQQWSIDDVGVTYDPTHI